MPTPADPYQEHQHEPWFSVFFDADGQPVVPESDTDEWEGYRGVPDAITKAGCLALAKRGAEVWNGWRAIYPVRWKSLGDRYVNRADFGGADFREHPIDFSSFKFGNAARFDGAQLGDGADFSNAQFGDEARFEGTQFGQAVHFHGTQFGETASFHGARFGAAASFHGVFLVMGLVCAVLTLAQERNSLKRSSVFTLASMALNLVNWQFF